MFSTSVGVLGPYCGLSYPCIFGSGVVGGDLGTLLSTASSTIRTRVSKLPWFIFAILHMSLTAWLDDLSLNPRRADVRQAAAIADGAVFISFESVTN